jgi:YD repeat-containing protein
MTTSADSQTTTISYDSLRRRSTVTYPGTTNNVVTTYTYDNADRITRISTTNTTLTYDLEISYVSLKDLIAQEVNKLGGRA